MEEAAHLHAEEDEGYTSGGSQGGDSDSEVGF